MLELCSALAHSGKFEYYVTVCALLLCDVVIVVVVAVGAGISVVQ